jgi:hypothetical protein
VALSADGNTALIGASSDDVGANADQGSATVFVRSGGVWTQQQQLSQSAGTASNFFGASVALSADGNTALIGATGNSTGGSATVFVRSGSTWSQQQTVTQTGAAALDSFGGAVALSSDGNTALIGAAQDNVGVNADQGSATVFVRSGSVWTQQQNLISSTGAASDRLGGAVALSSDGNLAIATVGLDDVGANTDQGSVTVFVRSGTVWTQQQTIIQNTGAANDIFGYSVALSADGTRALVAANYDDVGANMDQGSATVFKLTASTLTCQPALPEASTQAKPPPSVAWTALNNVQVSLGETLLVCISTPNEVTSVQWKGSSLTRDSMAGVVGARGYVYSLPSGDSGVSDLIINFTAVAAGGTAVTASKVTGLLTTGYLDKTTTGYSAANSTTPTAGPTPATTQADELLYACFAVNGIIDTTPVWNNSFTPGQQIGSTGGGAASNWTVYEASKEVAATGTYTASMTLTTGRPYAAQILTYKKSTVPTCSAYGLCARAGSLDFNGFQMRWCDGAYWRQLKAD